MGIGTSSSSRGAPAPLHANAYAVNRDASELGGLPRGQQPRPAHPVTTRARRCMSSFLLHEKHLEIGEGTSIPGRCHIPEPSMLLDLEASPAAGGAIRCPI